jgi:hypothetical protein
MENFNITKKYNLIRFQNKDVIIDYNIDTGEDSVYGITPLTPKGVEEITKVFKEMINIILIN